MKKFLFLAVVAVAFVACNSNKQAEAPVEEVAVETVEEVVAPVDSVAADSAAVEAPVAEEPAK